MTGHKEAEQPSTCIHIRALWILVLLLSVWNYFHLDVQEAHTEVSLFCIDVAACYLNAQFDKHRLVLNFTNGCMDLGQTIISYLNLWNWCRRGWKGGNECRRIILEIGTILSENTPALFFFQLRNLIKFKRRARSLWCNKFNMLLFWESTRENLIILLFHCKPLLDIINPTINVRGEPDKHHFIKYNNYKM